MIPPVVPLLKAESRFNIPATSSVKSPEALVMLSPALNTMSLPPVVLPFARISASVSTVPT